MQTQTDDRVREWDERADDRCEHDWRVAPNMPVRASNPPQQQVAVCLGWCKGTKWRTVIPEPSPMSDPATWPRWVPYRTSGGAK